jgi:2-keto-4-pentenoate hydratase/2-oxohepta-3-ene-1,7-dioic acid hydratase in catechol pathway
MNIVSFSDRHGLERVGVEVGDDIFDVTSFLPGTGLSPIRRLLALEDPATLLVRAEQDGARYPTSDVVIGPAVPDPSKIVAAPVNYRAHQAEMSQDAHIGALGVFLKAPSSVIGHGATVRLPYVDRRFDQEGELAVVIGKTARHVSAGRAMDYVFGYTCLLDMTMRGGEDRSTRKSFDTFTPVGPRIVTREAMPPVESLELRTRVNGTVRQRSDITDLIWDFPQLIAYASSVMTLNPGDIVTSGTPQGVGQVFDGDEVSVEVTGVGTLVVDVSAAGAVECPTQGAHTGAPLPTGITPVTERAG